MSKIIPIVKGSKPKVILPPQDKVDNAVMVHLERPAEFEASDKVYVADVLEKHPDLSEFIYEHAFCPVERKEHLVMAAFVFEYNAVKTALIKDCKFSIVEYIDRQGERMNLQEHARELMEKITKDAEVI